MVYGTHGVDYLKTSDGKTVNVSELSAASGEATTAIEGLDERVTESERIIQGIEPDQWKATWPPESEATGVVGDKYTHNGQVWTLQNASADVSLTEPSNTNNEWRRYADPLWSFVVSQYAEGSSANVNYLIDGVIVDNYDYLIYPVTNTVWSCAGRTGTIVGDFNESTGVDTGLSAPLTLQSIVAEQTDGIAGLVWNSEVDTYVRTGDLSPTAIQEGMRRCVLNTDGSVNYYLHPSDSTLKEDGVTASVLDGTDGNVMVEIPKFYYRYTVEGTSKKAEISAEPRSGFATHPAFFKDGVEVNNRYYRAYTGYNRGGTLMSISGVTPTRSFDFPTGRVYAKANGTGWGLTDWQLLHAVQLLCLIELGTFYTQSILGDGNSSGTDYGITTGQSNSIGNASSGERNDNTWMSYRGIENFYADCWEMVDGINVRDREVFVSTNQSTFASDIFTGDYVSTGVTMPTASSSYITNIGFSEHWFIPTAVGGSSSTFVTDGLWTNTGDRVVYQGGSTNDGALGGVCCLNAYGASLDSSVSGGAAVSF